ncbi:hypothetical protein NP493_176g03058 [Ridgeia piscesae]|uniref:Uncharacterized protein n=1 Tax=Ridgeia piscesae TaxID=27915 RepID=A0AAD9P371_RIDPI|nr:hypothetical protein NP493_176g03058 [Ridgeia piscesae]
MKGRKEVRVDVTKLKPIARMMTGRKVTGKKGTIEKAAGGKVSNQGDAKRRSYSEAVIEGALRTERLFMGDSILRKTDRTLSKGEDVVVCLPGASVANLLGHVQGGSILVQGFPTNCAALRTRAVTHRVKAAVHRRTWSVFVYIKLGTEVSEVQGTDSFMLGTDVSSSVMPALLPEPPPQSEPDKCNNIVTDPEDRRKEEQYITKARQQCGYPKWTISKIKEKQQNQRRKTKDKNKEKSRNQSHKLMNPLEIEDSAVAQPDGYGVTQMDDSAVAQTDNYGVAQMADSAVAQTDNYGVAQIDDSADSHKADYGVAQMDDSAVAQKDGYGVAQTD